MAAMVVMMIGFFIFCFVLGSGVERSFVCLDLDFMDAEFRRERFRV